jgi:hypothetical protein
MEQKEKKNWKTVLTNRKDKTEWVFPTLAVGSFSGVVVEMTGLDEETGEGVGTVVIGNVDKPTGVLKRTWQLRNFTPVDGTIEKVEVAKKVKA